MNRLIAAVLCCLAATACTQAPNSAPTSASNSAPTSASNSASTSVANPAGDSQAINDAFDTCTRAVLAKDGAAALPVLTSNTFKFYDEIRKQALTGTELTLPALGPSGQLLAYTMRGDLDHATLRTASPQNLVKTLIDKGLVTDDRIRDIKLGKLTINQGKALARVTVRGEPSTDLFGFALENDAWKFDLPAVIDSSERDQEPTGPDRRSAVRPVPHHEVRTGQGRRSPQTHRRLTHHVSRITAAKSVHKGPPP